MSGPRWRDAGGTDDGGCYVDRDLVWVRRTAASDGATTVGYVVAQCSSGAWAEAIARTLHLHDPLVALARAGADMRAAQRRYFQTRDRAALLASKEAEAAFDRLVAEMDAVEPISPQARCFL